ncbi:outer membrane beta-barrel protein [Veronia pacifica]|uniref:Outer membrane protein beta-barrel domain-containing protein n=1 Tax=Veronia pacifica TaxID=1080227 RepID=A0A1C3EM75_9GAMM|nr:outer membrane beta-barrel protein [Veronia pacifica]ODA34336.1 hypothetical protein A8L45_06320 [Veronia pacifica]
MKKNILALSLFAACSAHASAADTSFFYIGGGYGNTSNVKFSDDKGHSASYDVSKKTKRIYTGIRFNRFAALEGQYTDYGDPKVGKLDASSVTVLGNFGFTTDIGVRPFVNLGLGITAYNSGQNKKHKNEKDGRPSVRYGFGVEYTPKQLPQISVRLASEHDKVFMDNEDRAVNNPTMDLGSVYLGVSYNLY